MAQEHKVPEHLKDATSAYQRGDYAGALQLLYPIANKGDAEALFCLGLMYDNGHGVEKNVVEAANLFSKAAHQGHIASQYNLGRRYHLGMGVEKNHQEALIWYLKAAEQEHVFAQNNLGILYLQGSGVPQDYNEAFKWIFKSAHNGAGIAQSRLASMYLNGQGTPQDIRQAIIWYLIAAQQGVPEAIFVAEILHKSPDFLHLFSNISAGDRSMLVSFYKNHSTSPAVFMTAEGSANDLLWSEMQKLGWMIEVPIQAEIAEMYKKLERRSKHFSITELGFDKIKQLLSL